MKTYTGTISMNPALKPLLTDVATARTRYLDVAIIHPHPISGPLNIRQRFEFLRFHIDRHRGQVEATVPKAHYYRT